MTTSSGKVRKPAKKAVVTGFVHSMYFDLNFNFISETEERVTIPPGASRNWEYEICLSIPFVWHKYVRVCKSANGVSSKTLIKTIRQKVKAFVSEHSIESVKIDQQILEESFQDLNADPIVNKRGAGEKHKCN